MDFDVNFDHRLDSKGEDPDTHSPTLKYQHQLLWSKPLPDGTVFQLEQEDGKYLKHESHHGLFHISSDTISHSLRKQVKMLPLIEQIPSGQLDAFQAAGSVIGARIIFPGNRIDGHTTINQRRGMHNKINDRFDLTLECIRLHYLGEPHPLDDVLARYSDFFKLFRDFKNYVEFFFLQDLVSEDTGKMEFFLRHEPSFSLSPKPDSVDSYYLYMENSIKFVKARNERIQAWVEKSL
jgi:hypothetical protein